MHPFIVSPLSFVFISIFSMHCTFTEAARCLGFKSRASIYQLKNKGILKPYLTQINGENYLFMGAIRGVTLAKHIENNLTSNNWIPLNDYDLHLYIELANPN